MKFERGCLSCRPRSPHEQAQGGRPRDRSTWQFSCRTVLPSPPTILRRIRFRKICETADRRGCGQDHIPKRRWIVVQVKRAVGDLDAVQHQTVPLNQSRRRLFKVAATDRNVGHVGGRHWHVPRKVHFLERFATVESSRDFSSSV